MAIGVGLLTACSDEQKARQPPAAPVATSQAATSDPVPTEASTTAGAGRRYQVVAGTAYFVDSPESGMKPNGQYVLRGDVLYGEEERSGFVRTRVRVPGGRVVTGWLKREELGQLVSEAAPTRTVRAATPEPDAFSYEETPVAPDQPSAAAASGAQQAVVQVARSYFYDSPDLIQPRKAHCVQGDKVWLGEVHGDAVYVTFTNWEKVTSKGWMRRDALRPVL
ncbi:hypothetical protein [Hymenobacter fodinae]|uniref:Uncharacterized protein n=1 Tax=Hymenobacter fodinae TaxID=2510796 RepID=A0A4Z0P7Q6_9BACT|nr:hypothetical protein [Hymenobacter fodinae]TGE08454.1 hypothetical protein EU556_12135 [Hymenobacter fodinae]